MSTPLHQVPDHPKPSQMPHRRITVPDAETLNERVETIHDILDRLTGRVCKVEDVNDEHAKELKALRAENTELKEQLLAAGIKPKLKDEFNEQLLAFMRSLPKGCKLPVGAIVESMPGVDRDTDYSKVYNRVISLVAKGDLEATVVGEGKNRMYWAAEVAAE